MDDAALGGRDGWTHDEVLILQRRRLRALLAHAVAHSPYYREALGPDAADRPLAELPVLTKATLMEQFDRIVGDPRLRRSDLEAHLAGDDPGRSFLGEFRVATTSGTTGRRAIVVFTEREAATWRAVTERAGRRAGMRPGQRVAAIGSPSPAHLTRQVLAPPEVPAPLTAATPLPRLVAALDAAQPEVLICAAGIGSLLADEQLAGRLHIAPRSVAFGSEALTPDLRRRVRAAWGLEPTGMYAATEAPVIASSTPEHPELEVAEDVVVVEVVDEDDRPVPVGEPGAKVLVTKPERLRAALVAAVASTGALPPPVDVAPVASLAPGPGAKFRLVRSG